MHDDPPTEPTRSIYELNRKLRAAYKLLTGTLYPGSIQDDLGDDGEERLHRLLGAVIAAVNKEVSARDDTANK